MVCWFSGHQKLAYLGFRGLRLLIIVLFVHGLCLGVTA